jgi:hypothetical protein
MAPLVVTFFDRNAETRASAGPQWPSQGPNAQLDDQAGNETLDVKDVTWLSPTGEEITDEQWNDGNARSFGMLLDGRAQETGVKRRGRGHDGAAHLQFPSRGGQF